MIQEDIETRIARLEGLYRNIADSLSELREELAVINGALDEASDMLDEVMSHFDSEEANDDVEPDVEPDVDELKENEDFAHDGEIDNYELETGDEL